MTDTAWRADVHLEANSINSVNLSPSRGSSQVCKAHLRLLIKPIGTILGSHNYFDDGSHVLVLLVSSWYTSRREDDLTDDDHNPAQFSLHCEHLSCSP